MMTQCVLAQIQTPPFLLVGYVLWGLIGILGVVVLVFTAVEKGRRVFGRVPPLNDVIAGLATIKDLNAINTSLEEIKESLKTKIDQKEMEASAADREDLRRELNARSKGLELQISDIRHKAASKDDLNTVNLRAEAYRHEVLEVRDQVNRLHERTEEHIRKFDRLSNQMERWIERLTNHREK
jgi:chromosome segregation ATPase